KLTADEPVDRSEQDKLAQLAVHFLERAFLESDHDLIARHRDWVLSDDPDLANLRPHQLFRQFESRFFPSQFPAYPRPSSIHPIEASRNQSELLASGARVMEQRWHHRRNLLKGSTDIHTQIKWWQEEVHVLLALSEFCLNSRHWQSRIRLL